MDLRRQVRGPLGAELGGWRAGLEQHRAAGPGAGQRQHQVGGQFFGGTRAPFSELAQSDVAGICESFVQRRKGLAVVEVRRVHRVPCLPQYIRDGADAFGQALRVVQHEHFSG
jgi:hypothetical protein